MDRDSCQIYLPWGSPSVMMDDIRNLFAARWDLPLYCITPHVLLVAAHDTINAASSARERRLKFQRACRAVQTRITSVDTNRTTCMQVSQFILHSCHLTFIRSYNESTICMDWQFYLVFLSMLEQSLRGELHLRRQYAIRSPPGLERQQADSGESIA